MDFRTISGGALPLVVSSAGEGPDVVLFHGFPDTPYSWADTESVLLDAGWRVTIPWLRGYHPQTIVAGRAYDPQTLGRDALALLDALDMPRAVIVGHDWGALIAYVAAALAPERVAAIVTLGIPHPSLLSRRPSLLWAARHFAALRLPGAAARCRRGDFAYLELLYRRWAPGWSGPQRDQSIERVKQALTPASTLDGAIAYYRALPVRPPRVLQRVPELPGLIVGGQDDAAQRSAFDRTAELMGGPSRAVVVPRAGHWPHREQPGIVLPELRSFLTSVRQLEA